MLLVVVIIVSVGIAYKILKYEKTVELINTEFETDGVLFRIVTKYYRRIHITKKRRHVYQTIISGNKVLPNIFLDAHYGDRYLYATEYDTYDQSQRISLEGDFDNYFQLYAPAGLEHDALSLMTPDTMYILIDNLKMSDVITDATVIELTSNNPQPKDELLKGIQMLLSKVARFYRLTTKDEELKYQRMKLSKNSVDEAVKFYSKLVSAKVLAYIFVTIIPGIPYVIFFIIRDGEVQPVGFIIGLLVTMSFGLLAVFLLHASEAGWIKLDRTKK